MAVDLVVPFTSSVGSKYLINFKDFPHQGFSLPVLDVSLVLVEPSNQLLNLNDLFDISHIILDYINNNDVILYYYCDTNATDIFISKKRSLIQPQEYRHNLFNALFSYMKQDNLVKDEIIIDDPAANTHYISLITKAEHKSSLTEVSIEVQKMNDK